MAFTVNDVGLRVILKAWDNLTPAQQAVYGGKHPRDRDLFQVEEELPESEKLAVIVEWNSEQIKQKKNGCKNDVLIEARKRAKEIIPEFDDITYKIANILNINNQKILDCKSIFDFYNQKINDIDSFTEAELDSYNAATDPGWPK